MSELWFYHLEHVSLERVLPDLVEKTMARGWRAVIRTSSTERAEALDTLLWTYSEESFVPHGMANETGAEMQPIVLTAENVNPNKANILFLVDGADTGEAEGYERSVFIFDGRDEAALGRARQTWKAAKADGREVSYWRQSAQGRWEKQG